MKWLEAKSRRPDIQNKAITPATEDKNDPPVIDATEAAARLAEENGIDLGEVKGSGVGGRIIIGDVEALLPPDDAA